MNIIFRNIEGKSAIFGEFVMLLGPLTVGENRRYKVELLQIINVNFI